jgi:hypothetical protein
MPQLKYLFKNVITSDYRILRGKIMECISLIGLAVSKEKVCICFLFASIKLCFVFSLSTIVVK